MTLSETVKKLLINITFHFFIALICGMMINALIKFDTQTAFITGLSLGGGLAAVKVLLMERGISKSLTKQSAQAGIYAVLQITLRNVISAGLLTCGVLFKSISIWGVLAGLTLLQSAAFTVKWQSVKRQGV